MPRGGYRVGAGRKTNKAPSIVVGMDGKPRASAPALPPGPTPAEAAGHPLAEPPAGLGESQATVWRALAPFALSQQTLVAATVRGFIELCEQVVLKQQVADTILAAGASTNGMDALLRHYAKLAQRVDGTLARYRLTANGKPEAAAANPKKATPWSAVATK